MEGSSDVSQIPKLEQQAN